MEKRFVSLWFPHLITDWVLLQKPVLKATPFVLASPRHGRMIVSATSAPAAAAGIETGMVVADARVLFPQLAVFPDREGRAGRLLTELAAWCIRFTPVVALDLPDGLLLDASGCAHLWKGELPYLHDLLLRLRQMGYHVRAGMADTIGTAWAVARFRSDDPVVPPGMMDEALGPLPSAALRLPPEVLERLDKLGFYRIESFLPIPASVLRRRFGEVLPRQLSLALGYREEPLKPVRPLEPYFERLPAPEPILTATGIEIALHHLLEALCTRLAREGKGLRKAFFRGYRLDHEIVQLEIGTSRASCHGEHLFRLFDISKLAPEPGIELFELEAPVVEDLLPAQEALWNLNGGKGMREIAELLDKLTGRAGANIVHRYLPAEHYWPERSVAATDSLEDVPGTPWPVERPRPVHLLSRPEAIQVTAPVPDYPPMLFRYRGEVHRVSKADGPERIEQEWWLEQSAHRDYYVVEDERGARYWIFRLGHYDGPHSEWFLHGFFA